MNNKFNTVYFPINEGSETIDLLKIGIDESVDMPDKKKYLENLNVTVSSYSGIYYKGMCFNILVSLFLNNSDCVDKGNQVGHDCVMKIEFLFFVKSCFKLLF